MHRIDNHNVGWSESTPVLQEIVEKLCSKECAGRKPGTVQGRNARQVIVDGFRHLGFDPHEQQVPGCGGANVLARVEGTDDRYIVVGAHFDHLGIGDAGVYWGADDNAAAVAILLSVAAKTVADRSGKGIIFAAFDGEEPPYFGTNGMGSRVMVQNPPVPLSQIDFMICMDLVGHRLGSEALPGEIGNSLFALGAERSVGTSRLLAPMSRAVPDLVVRPLDAEVVTGMSDYVPFSEADIPFLFLTGGRSSVYHTPADTPDKLDYAKMTRTAQWLHLWVSELRKQDGPISFDANGCDHLGTLREFLGLLDAVPGASADAKQFRSTLQQLVSACDSARSLGPEHKRLLVKAAATLEGMMA